MSFRSRSTVLLLALVVAFVAVFCYTGLSSSSASSTSNDEKNKARSLRLGGPLGGGTTAPLSDNNKERNLQINFIITQGGTSGVGGTAGQGGSGTSTVTTTGMSVINVPGSNIDISDTVTDLQTFTAVPPPVIVFPSLGGGDSPFDLNDFLNGNSGGFSPESDGQGGFLPPAGTGTNPGGGLPPGTINPFNLPLQPVLNPDPLPPRFGGFGEVVP